MNKHWPLTEQQRADTRQELEDARYELWLRLHTGPTIDEGLDLWSQDLTRRRKEILRLEQILADD